MTPIVSGEKTKITVGVWWTSSHLLKIWGKIKLLKILNNDSSTVEFPLGSKLSLESAFLKYNISITL